MDVVRWIPGKVIIADALTGQILKVSEMLIALLAKGI